MLFFQFFKISIFWVARGVKGQKTVQNDKKFRLSHLISQVTYIIWFLFTVYVSKMIISLGVFCCCCCFFFLHFFQFFELLGVKRAKNCPKWQKNSFCHTWYVKNLTLYDRHLCYTCVKWYLEVVFSFFQSFDFLCC